MPTQTHKQRDWERQKHIQTHRFKPTNIQRQTLGQTNIPPRHSGIESERDNSTHEHKDSDKKKQTKTDTGIRKYPPRHTGTESERDKTHTYTLIQIYKQTKTGTRTKKRPPIHTGTESERDNTWCAVISEPKLIWLERSYLKKRSGN